MAGSELSPAFAPAPVVVKRQWLTVYVICLVQFVVVLNFQSVWIALPIIQRALDLDQNTLLWVVTASELAFAGSLMLAGQVADMWGHRRLFLIGLLLFTAASFACGLATAPVVLIGARAVQGLASAIATPAALALLSTTMPNQAARTRALGLWGIIGPLGGICGSSIGGMLAGYGWQWVFWLNIPLCLAAFTAASVLLPASSAQPYRSNLDVQGAIVGTAALTVLVYALTQARQNGFVSLYTVACIGCAFALAAGFWAIERRATNPLLPLHILGQRMIIGSNIIALIHAVTTNTPILFFTLYMQQIRGLSPLQTGLAFVPTNFGIIAGSALGTRLLARIGSRFTAVVGMGCVAVAHLLYSRMDAGNDYVVYVLPGLLLMGFGLGATALAVNAANATAVEAQHGLAWGLINTSARIGTALGLAVLASVASAATATRDSMISPQQALLFGFHWAYYGGAGFAVVGAIMAFTLLRDTKQG